MISRKLSIYGFISAAAVVSGVLVGCGGSSSGVGGTPGTVVTTGGVGSTTQTFSTGVGSTTAPQQVQVTVNGSNVNASLPAGTSIPAGTSVAVVPPTPIIVGLTQQPKVVGEKAAPQAGTPYEVYDNGHDTGVSVTSAGALSGYLILTTGTHLLTTTGPFSIVGGTAFNPAKLTVATFNFKVIVLADGTPSIPTSLNMKLPINGGTLAHGSFVTAAYDAPFVGYHGTLTIKYGATTVVKSVPLVLNSSGDAQATYNALSAHPAIPRTAGVDSVTFDINP